MAGSMRQRGKQSWELRVHAGRDLETGRKQYVTRTVHGTKREAARELARLVSQVDDGLVAAKAGTVGELCERWFAQAQPGLSPTASDGYRRILDRHVLPRWGATPLRRLRTADLDAWYAQLRNRGGIGGRALAPNTVLRIHAVLHRALRQAVKWGWLATNPAAATSPPRSKRHQVTVPDPADVLRLVEAAEAVNPDLPVFLRLAAATGARRGELCALRWHDLDLTKARMTISRGLVEVNGALVEKDTKTQAERRITLDPGTVAVIDQHHSRRAEIAEHCGVELAPGAFVFSHEVDGSTPWRPGYVTLAFTRLRDELGLDGVRLHDLRHFNATSLLAGGTDIRTVSGRLGHADASTTLDIYSHFLEPADREAAARLGGVLDGPRPLSGRRGRMSRRASSRTASANGGRRSPVCVASGPAPALFRTVRTRPATEAPMIRTDDRLTYTVEETARLLGISRGSAYECVRTGEIPALTLGRRILVPRVALEQILADASLATRPGHTSAD